MDAVATLTAAALITAIGIATIGYLVGEWREVPWARAICKPIASAGFLALAVTAGAFDASYGIGIFVALVCCWFGDVFLLSRAKTGFLAGLGAFLLGHVVFAAVFWRRGVDTTWLATSIAPLACVSVAISLWLLPNVERPMRIPVSIYVIAITLMVALAVGTYGDRSNTFIPIGAALFMVSDIAVARERFVARQLSNRLWGLPTYYAAQVLLALSIATR